MGKATQQKKEQQLGMSLGKARRILESSLMFDLAKQLGLLTCYRCQKPIETVRELSRDHKVPWLDSINPVELYFDINNIAFSHLSCNSGDSRGTRTPVSKHGTNNRYNKYKCRCIECKAARSQRLHARDSYGASGPPKPS